MEGSIARKNLSCEEVAERALRNFTVLALVVVSYTRTIFASLYSREFRIGIQMELCVGFPMVKRLGTSN